MLPKAPKLKGPIKLCRQFLRAIFIYFGFLSTPVDSSDVSFERPDLQANKSYSPVKDFCPLSHNISLCSNITSPEESMMQSMPQENYDANRSGRVGHYSPNRNAVHPVSYNTNEQTRINSTEETCSDKCHNCCFKMCPCCFDMTDKQRRNTRIAIIALIIAIILLLVIILPFIFLTGSWAPHGANATHSQPDSFHSTSTEISNTTSDSAYRNFEPYRPEPPSHAFDNTDSPPLLVVATTHSPDERAYPRPPVEMCTSSNMTHYFVCNTPHENIVIGANQRCDGVKDCPDNADETNCVNCLTSRNCTSNRGQNVCLRGSEGLCNGQSFCMGNSEQSEDICEVESCNEETHYRCVGTKICLPIKWKCDGDEQCPDGDDERACTNEACTMGATFCKASGRCLPTWQICDGRQHCSDGSDELNCTCDKCAMNGGVLCSNVSKTCILRSMVCDGHSDCPESEDEINCPGSCPIKDDKHSSNITMVVCQDGVKRSMRHACSGMFKQCDEQCENCNEEVAFKCTSGERKCILRRETCDGLQQCTDGSDEADDLCKCDEKSFKCLDTSGQERCIPIEHRCDGVNDCVDESDELNCAACATITPNATLTTPHKMYCAADSKCIAAYNVCDGRVDCSDYSDEDYCDCELCKSNIDVTFMCPGDRHRCLLREEICRPGASYECPQENGNTLRLLETVCNPMFDSLI